MNWKRILFVMLALLITLSAGATWVAAQTTNSGSVSGTVTDPSGAVVPGATVTIKNLAHGTVFQATTNSSGAYNFALLEPGTYTLTVEATGFTKATSTMDVSVSQTTTGNISLAVATAGTTVTVTEAAPLAQTENGDVSTSLSAQQVSQVPNPGNDLSYVAQIAPGVKMNTNGGYGNFSSFGLPGTSNLFTLNGMDDNDPFLNLNNSGATNLLLGQNEVQEATVVNNGYSGQFGGLAGANVNYITKSGGNQFHGNAIYFWNGSAMNATDFISNATDSPKPFDNANQWAASLGGPIKKDKLFFFFNTEGLRVLLPAAAATVRVPSQAFEADTLANLAAIGDTASVPYYQNMFSIYNGNPNYSRAVPGQNPGDTSNADSCTSSITGFLQQTVDPALGVSEPCVMNFTTSPTQLTHEYQLAGRIDWNVGPKDQVFFRYQYDNGLQATFTDLINPLFNATSQQPEHQGQMLETHAFGPTASNQLLIAGSWYTAIFSPANLPATLAVQPADVPVEDGSLSTIGRALVDWPQGRNVAQAQIQDDFSKTMGHHTLKFGVKWRRNWVNDFDFGFFTNPLTATFSLQDYFNGGFDPTNGAVNVIGIGSEGESSFPSANNQPFAAYSLQGYFQDEWRMKPNFTLTLALRAEHFSNPVCQHLCGSGLQTPYTGIAGLADGGDIPYNTQLVLNQQQALLSLQNIAWEPRVSFAWQPFSGSNNRWTSNFVVRGGFGLFADQFPGQAAELAAQNPPNDNTFVSVDSCIAPTETNCPQGFFAGNLVNLLATTNSTFVNGFPNGITGNELAAASLGVLPNLTTFDNHNSYPMYEKWSLEVQKGFGANTVLDVLYAGNHGYHELIQNNSINGFGFGDLPAAAPTPQYAEVNWVTSAGVSNYNGLTTTFQHRFTKWTQGVFQFNYTWSHAFDEISNGGFLPFSFNSAGVANSINPQDPYNFRGNYGPADYDARHYVNANYVWELPVRKMFGGRGNKYLVDGWQVSGTIFYRTGFPYSVYDGGLSGGLAGQNYFGTILPQFLGGGIANCGTGAVFTNPVTPCETTAQFTAAGAETGFTGGLRNFFYGPGYFNTDFTIIKNTQIPGWEAGKLGIGFQFFNLFNHPNFGNPDSDITSNTFGQITGQVAEPTSILGSFLGGNASPRLIQLKAQLTF